MSQIEKWRRQVVRHHEKFVRCNNIHDYINWKKYSWLIEGYKQGLEDGQNGNVPISDWSETE